MGRIIPDKLYLSLLFRHRMGYWMDWNNPRTFNEKLQWLKLFDRHDEYSRLVDKYEVKEYVTDIIGEEYIIPTLGVWNSFDEIDFSKLPDKFVLKCTHDSGGVVICHDKPTFDFTAARKKLNHNMHMIFYYNGREFPYKNVKPRIIAEKYMESGGNDLIDYKFYCFDGSAKYCQVIANRSKDETIDFYDREWKHQPFIGLFPTAHHAPKPHHAPKHYDIMVNIADKLSQDVGAPFVRIDLYNIHDKIYFGEITFFPLSGMGFFRPQEWDLKLGEYIKLPHNQENNIK